MPDGWLTRYVYGCYTFTRVTLGCSPVVIHTFAGLDLQFTHTHTRLVGLRIYSSRDTHALHAFTGLVTHVCGWLVAVLRLLHFTVGYVCVDCGCVPRLRTRWLVYRFVTPVTPVAHLPPHLPRTHVYVPVGYVLRVRLLPRLPLFCVYVTVVPHALLLRLRSVDLRLRCISRLPVTLVDSVAARLLRCV